MKIFLELSLFSFLAVVSFLNLGLVPNASTAFNLFIFVISSTAVSATIRNGLLK